MSKLKERIPDEVTLRRLVDESGPELLTEVRSAVGSIETEYIKHRRRARYGPFLFVAMMLFIYVIDINLPHGQGSVQQFMDAIAMAYSWLWFPGLLVLIYLANKFFQAGKGYIAHFHRGVNESVLTYVCTLFRLSGTWTDGASARGQVEALITHSELITEQFDQLNVDTMLTIKHGDSTLFVAEIEVKNTTDSRVRKVKKIFKGYFVSFDLQRSLAAKTFVSTEGDTTGFANQTLLSGVLPSEVTKTTLEWNEFERLLRVTTTNELEARYVLSTNVMLDLYEWWKDKKGSIRLSFIENRLYMLFPDDKIKFYDTVPKIEETALTNYLYSIAKPLMHVIHLIEDVKV